MVKLSMVEWLSILYTWSFYLPSILDALNKVCLWFQEIKTGKVFSFDSFSTIGVT